MKTDPDFYVGYLPVPRSLKRWLLSAILTLLVVIIGSAIAIAALQKNPGNGDRDIDHLTEFTGIIRFQPYPMLVTEHQTLLLVDEGKFGADLKLQSIANHQATLSGHVMRRGDLFLLELADENPIQQVGDLKNQTLEPVSTHHDTFTGEIIDPKCFTGAMKPGQGKTHKSCAVLCLEGGIPPVFLNHDGLCYLLTDSNGHALIDKNLEQILPYVSDLVSLSGDVAHVGDHLQLRLDLSSIRRL